MTDPLTIVVIALIILVVGYLCVILYTPLPSNIPHSWQFQCCMAWKNLASLLGRISDYLGFTSGMESSRTISARAFRMFSKPVGSKGLKIKNTVLEGVHVRIYSPDVVKDNEQFPVIVYFHGGGFATFSVDTYDNILRAIARDTRSIVFAPEYRLAPEHPFPAGLNDCYDVTAHILQNAVNYNGDSSRVAVAGDSCGGNLAAAVAWKTKQNPHLPSISLQILLYPMLQAFNFCLPSYTDGLVLLSSQKTLFAMLWYAYCAGSLSVEVPQILANKHIPCEMRSSPQAAFANFERSGDDNEHVDINEALVEKFQPFVTNPEFSPLMASDCAVFPTTYLLSAEHDVLRDENILFVERLVKAGVNVEHNHIAGGWHGVVSYTRTTLGRKALDDVIQYIKANL